MALMREDHAKAVRLAWALTKITCVCLVCAALWSVYCHSTRPRLPQFPDPRTRTAVHSLWLELWLMCHEQGDDGTCLLAAMAGNAAEWGQNGTSEALCDAVEGQTRPDPIDTDGDGHLEVSDGWGNPMAVLCGNPGVGALYRLRDGRWVKLVEMDLVPRKTHPEPVSRMDSLGQDGVDLVCIWSTGPEVFRTTYNGWYVQYDVIGTRPMYLFPILLSGAPGGYLLSVEKTNAKSSK